MDKCKSAHQKRLTFHLSSKTSAGSSSGSTSKHQFGTSLNSSFIDLTQIESNEILLEDERPALPGVPIRAATASALVKLCIQAFDPKCGEVRPEFVSNNGLSYPKILFVVHKWFLTSQELASLFLEHYDLAFSFGPRPDCHHSSEDEGNWNESLERCKCEQYRDSICHSIRFWIVHFPLHFDVDEKLREMVREFGGKLREERRSWLFDLNSLQNYDWIRNISVKEKPDANLSRKFSLIFNHLEPSELAQNLTFLEHKLIRRIGFEDFKNYASSGQLEDNPRLERSVSLFNGLSQWIQCVVLSRPTPQQRADVIVKFVRVAKNLRRLQNFNSLMGVVGSLSHSALARLSKTMDCVPSEEKKILKDLTKLVSSASNFSSYRKALSECKGFKIPILGVHLKDLICLHTALPDKVDKDLINFRKMTQLSTIFHELQLMQSFDPPLQANLDLLNTLRISLDLAYSEDEIYSLSLSREPKSSTQSSPTRSSPVIDTHERQVKTCVDAVFRSYDSNHDGFISKDEYQAILTNFPSIDAFFVLDENRDGMISKNELEKYLRNRKNVASRHIFHETTYFKPTFCFHCSGLLWGIIKQGFKCKNCGINVHKFCVEYLLHECKTGQLLFLSSPEPHSKRRVFRRRKKTSSQSEADSPPSPKYFNSLEQLSLSLESNESGSGTSKIIRQSSCEQSITGKRSESPMGLGGREATTSSVMHSHMFQSTPKNLRRFSALGGTAGKGSHSVSLPSSPKLGFANLSIPIWSPCRNFLHNFSHHGPNTQPEDLNINPSSPSPSPSTATNTTMLSPVPAPRRGRGHLGHSLSVVSDKR